MINDTMRDALQFYLDNGLNEVIAEKSQDNFSIKEKHKEVKIVVAPTVKKAENQPQVVPSIATNIVKKSAANHFIKPHFSTNEALSTLAKKTIQNGSENVSADQKFQSLNEIVAQAKSLAQAAKNLEELRKAVENFDGCNLKKMATNTVFCDGNPNSKVMVIGEAPGNHEDLQGIPFCGDSGKVLDDMFRAINMRRADNFYITNVIFWRPPGNRRPTDEELAICRPFVERHIQLLNPDVIVLVGATSMAAILGITDPISSIRGNFMDYSPPFLSRTIKSFAIFHPSYLMRQSAKKKIAWADMLALEQFLQNK